MQSSGDALKNFAKFKGKSQSLLLNNIKGLSPSILLKQEVAQVFSCKIFEFIKNDFFTDYLRATASAGLKMMIT